MYFVNWKRTQLRFVLMGILKIWGLSLAIGLPIAAVIAVATVINRHNSTYAILFYWAIFISVMGGLHGYQHYVWSRDDEERKKRDEEQKKRDEERRKEDELRDKERQQRRLTWMRSGRDSA